MPKTSRSNSTDSVDSKSSIKSGGKGRRNSPVRTSDKKGQNKTTSAKAKFVPTPLKKVASNVTLPKTPSQTKESPKLKVTKSASNSTIPKPADKPQQKEKKEEVKPSKMNGTKPQTGSKGQDKPAPHSPAAELGTGPEIPLQVGGGAPGTTPPKKVYTFEDVSGSKNPYGYVTNSSQEAVEAEKLVNSIKPVDLSVLMRNTSTVPTVYRTIKNDRRKIKDMVERAAVKMAPMIKERNELQLDVEGLIMFASQEREYNNVLSMYNRTTSSELQFKSVLKFKNPSTGEEVEYDESLSESAIGYLERKLAKKMNEVHHLSKLKKSMNDKVKLISKNLQSIRQWARTNSIKYKNVNEPED